MGHAEYINMPQAVLRRAKLEIIKHSDEQITLAGVCLILDRLIAEYADSQ